MDCQFTLNYTLSEIKINSGNLLYLEPEARPPAFWKFLRPIPSHKLDTTKYTKSQIIEQSSNRVLCGLCFFNVEKILKRNFPKLHSETVLNFLTFIHKKDHINILFSGDIELKLYGSKIFLRLDDLNKEWPTIFIPDHK